MVNESQHWALPLLAAGQAQKELTHNEAVQAIDRLLHLAVVTRSLSAPPTDPLPGDMYIVADAPTGDWEGNASMLAAFEGDGWLFTSPRTGCLAWVGDEALFCVYAGGGWSAGTWPVKGLSIDGRTMLAAAPFEITLPDGGATVDSECRATLLALLVVLAEQGVIKQS